MLCICVNLTDSVEPENVLFLIKSELLNFLYCIYLGSIEDQEDFIELIMESLFNISNFESFRQEFLNKYSDFYENIIICLRKTQKVEIKNIILKILTDLIKNQFAADKFFQIKSDVMIINSLYDQKENQKYINLTLRLVK